MKLLIKVSCPSFDHRNCNYAIATIGSVEKLYLLHRRELLSKITGEVTDAHQLTFWGSFAKYYDNLDLDLFLDAAQQHEFEEEEYVQIPEDFEPHKGEARTEYELTVLSEDGFYFSAQSLEMDVPIETSGMSFSVLDKIKEAA
jgi:hypothetical protein